MPNFLTRYDESKQPIHSVMIDFQLTRYSSLAQDLHFFIYACTDADMRAERYEDMLKYYCHEFNEFFAQLCPKHVQNEVALSYDDLMDELKANGMFALSMSMEACIMSMLDDDEVSDLDQIEVCIDYFIMFSYYYYYYFNRDKMPFRWRQYGL